jgi:hypothetical protein
VIALIISQISRVVGGRIDRAEAARNLAQAELLEVEDASGTLFTKEQLHTTVTRYAGLPAQEFLTVSSATFASFPNGNRSTTMFALWEWKCSILVELLAVAGVRGGRMAELVLARAAATSSWGQ